MWPKDQQRIEEERAGIAPPAPVTLASSHLAEAFVNNFLDARPLSQKHAHLQRLPDGERRTRTADTSIFEAYRDTPQNQPIYRAFVPSNTSPIPFFFGGLPGVLDNGRGSLSKTPGPFYALRGGSETSPWVGGLGAAAGVHDRMTPFPAKPGDKHERGQTCSAAALVYPAGSCRAVGSAVRSDDCSPTRF